MNLYVSLPTLGNIALLLLYYLCNVLPVYLNEVFIAFKTLFLWTGPMAMLVTGILDSLRNSRRASKEPRVDAYTQTPSWVLSTYLSIISNIPSWISAHAASTSSGVDALRSSEPAIAYSRLGAAILIPMAPLIFSWETYSFLTLSSFIGWGVKRALT